MYLVLLTVTFFRYTWFTNDIYRCTVMIKLFRLNAIMQVQSYIVPLLIINVPVLKVTHTRNQYILSFASGQRELIFVREARGERPIAAINSYKEWKIQNFVACLVVKKRSHACKFSENDGGRNVKGGRTMTRETPQTRILSVEEPLQAEEPDQLDFN